MAAALSSYSTHHQYLTGFQAYLGFCSVMIALASVGRDKTKRVQGYEEFDILQV